MLRVRNRTCPEPSLRNKRRFDSATPTKTSRYPNFSAEPAPNVAAGVPTEGATGPGPNGGSAAGGPEVPRGGTEPRARGPRMAYPPSPRRNCPGGALRPEVSLVRRTVGYRQNRMFGKALVACRYCFVPDYQNRRSHGVLSSARRIHKIMDLCVSTDCRIKTLNPDDHKSGHGLPISIYSLN